MQLSGVRRKQTDLLHVGLNAPNEERVGYTQSGHESVEGVLGRWRITNNNSNSFNDHYM